MVREFAQHLSGYSQSGLIEMGLLKGSFRLWAPAYLIKQAQETSLS